MLLLPWDTTHEVAPSVAVVEAIGIEDEAGVASSVTATIPFEVRGREMVLNSIEMFVATVTEI